VETGAISTALPATDSRVWLGVLFYLYCAEVSVPLLGTDFVETPALSGTRSIVHFILFLLCFYFGWVKKPKV
jgi:hypothetical protein